ncbi:MAG: nicotinate-nucleotide--dimethylbenzimidazole phosphoribosyltransferase [Acidimicrobiales bacterium]
MPPFDEAVAAVVPVDDAAAAAASVHHGDLTKPPGSLGHLEDAGVRLAGIARRCPPPVPAPAAVTVFAGDHGVLAQGVSPWPQDVTAQMVANFTAGGAAVNVLARHVGATVTVVDVGVVTDLSPAPGLQLRKVRRGTADLSCGPAMSDEEAAAALDIGAEVAADLVAGGVRCLLTGDMGIGNTTPSAALIAALSGMPAESVTGRGTGIDDDGLEKKRALVGAAAARVAGVPPRRVLAEVGGLEIAALAGYVVGGAAAGVPVLLDGLIACAAALVAAAIVPAVTGYLFAGHRSAEPGATVALERLGLVPLLDLGLRLGEGTGACLALPLLQAAAKVLGEMATFASAGVSGRDVEPATGADR